MHKRFYIALACIFTWIGFIAAISFMEAWLKFRAPGVGLAEGLSIGNLVFKALNRVEWCLFLISAASIADIRKHIAPYIFFLDLIVLCVLLLQTFFLLPALSLRTEIFIRGGLLEASNHHFYFVAAEVLKIVILLSISIGLFSNYRSILSRN